MSTILDALKKSERERTLARGPGFGDAGRRWARRAGWSHGTVTIGAIAVAVILVIAAVWARGRAISMEAAPDVAPSVAPVTPGASTADTVPLRAQAKITHEPRTARAGAIPGSNAQAAEAGYASAMGPDFQRSLPTMTVNIHVYTPEESRRILYVNNRQYRRGDEIPGGVVVEEIVPDGVVLRFRGRRFKLPRPS